ncbi:uncharacterized protein LOC130284685 isoform X2 [Hyla sarda]|uniref:uncharacterized protein LOC130284685 isoform X2 n=1 Tax=Hyla sarda TaxID=327740 RepID=UPI0024C27B82|nr:uncharacterized protein LOC130284685 isoform X2 [Hyla sarda]
MSILAMDQPSAHPRCNTCGFYVREETCDCFLQNDLQIETNWEGDPHEMNSPVNIPSNWLSSYQSIIQNKQLKQTSNRSLQNMSKRESSCTASQNQTMNIKSETFLVNRQHSAINVYKHHDEMIRLKSTTGNVTTFSQVHGYQSGESKMSDIQRLCKGCKHLYKKVRKRNPIIEDPNTTDPSLWYSQSWVFINKVPARRSKTFKRSLGSVLRSLGGMQPSRGTSAARIYWTCYRPPLFLKRNIRLHKEKQKKLFENEGRKRKQPNSGHKLKKPKKAVSSNQPEKSQRSKIAGETHSFVLESSQEEETGPDIKRFKLEIKNAGKKPSVTHRETSNSTSSCLAHSPTPCSGPMMPLGVTGPAGHCPLLPAEYSLQIGSFKEQLERLNMGLLKSAIVKEN